jgi:hypothetical protein
MGAEPAVVLNVDDVGMCHGANTAFLALRRAGVVDSGSVMVPCPWFSEIAEIAADDPSLALGVHATLTSEKRHYRWGPLTRASRASGLVDHDGYFWRTVGELRRHAAPEAVEAELRAQIDRARAAGIPINHLDSHMGAVFSPEFVDIYVQLGLDYGLPTMFPADFSSYDPIHNLGPVEGNAFAAQGERLARAGQTLTDIVHETPWHRDQPSEARYAALFGKIGDGLNFFCLHPNAPGELEAIEPSTAQIRIDEFELFSAPPFRTFLDGLAVRRGSLRDFSRLGSEVA